MFEKQGPVSLQPLRNNNQHRQQRQPQLLLPCESELCPLHGKDIFLLERGRLWEWSCSEMSSAVPQHSLSITGRLMQFKIPRNKTFPNLTSHKCSHAFAHQYQFFTLINKNKVWLKRTHPSLLSFLWQSLIPGGKHLACPAQLLKCHLCPGTVRNWNCFGAQNGSGPGNVQALQLCPNCPLTNSFREGWWRPGRESAGVNLLLEIKSSCDRKENVNNYQRKILSREEALAHNCEE